MCKTNLAAALLNGLYASGGHYHERCVAPGDSPEVRPEDRALFCVGVYETRDCTPCGDITHVQEVWAIHSGGDQVGAPLSSSHPHDTGASLSALLTAAAQGRLILLDEDGAPVAPSLLVGPTPNGPRTYGPVVTVGGLARLLEEREVPPQVARLLAPAIAHQFESGKLTQDEAAGAVSGAVSALALASEMLERCQQLLTEREPKGATLKRAKGLAIEVQGDAPALVG